MTQPPALKLPPPGVARVIEVLRNGLQIAQRSSVPPPIAMLEMITAAWFSQALCAAAQLGVADVLHAGPLTIDDLANRVNAHPAALRRLLRALAQCGIFAFESDGRVAQSTLSDCLRADAQPSLRSFALFVSSPEHRQHWSELEYSVRTGETAIPRLRGLPFFDWLETVPEFAEVFNDAMTSVSDMAKHPLLAAYDFRSFGTIVDVGGGHGKLLAAVLRATPSAQGVLYDLANVVEGAPSLLAGEGVAGRCRIESGSFFDHVPAGGDAYLLKQVLHDWDTSKAEHILRNVRRAIHPGGKLLVMEMVLPEGDAPHFGKLLDLEMLLTAGGQERNKREFSALFASAGFQLTRVVQTASPISIVEGVPV